MEFIDLAEQQKRILPGIEKRIARVLAHGKYIMGPEVFDLEARLAAYSGVRHAVSCASGTDALLMVLMALDIGPGDAVFTTPFTFVATAEVICLLGATPVFVDVDPDTWNMDPAALDKAVREVKASPLVPRCVIPVDIFGLPADYDAVNAVAGRYGLFVLEDAAQSFGAGYRGKKAGSLGHAAATSFFPAKPLGCYGDGGAVFTDDDSLAEKLVSIRVHGKGTHKYDNVRIGINGRLDTIQAAVLLEKLRIFDIELAARNQVADLYRRMLKDRVVYQAVPRGVTSAWAQFSIRHPDRDRIMAELKAQQIPTAVYYPSPLHCQTAFAGLGYAPGDFPVALALSQNIFSLPMHPYLEEADIQRVCDVIC
ncbi:MAG: DegT/DnrJ/EryC1/StrS family aminotransferase [Desulfotignum sp.]|nr:DegT/DnrJ/EryC1/StrS family aminotransferase [Desulfotignum sp.]